MALTYSVRVRLRGRSGDSLANLELVNALFASLDRTGVAEDVSEPGPDGSYTVWLTVSADHPSGAVAHSMACLERAQHETRPLGPLDEVVSIELTTAADPTDELPAMPTDI